VIDLHSHSNFSDGSESPTRVIELAAAAGLTAIALTDHDGLEGLPEAARRANELGITLVSGCEVSCLYRNSSLHVLCYFVADGPGALQEELIRLQEDRATRNERLISRLNELGIPITLEEVAERAGGRGIGRPHVAAVLVDRGVVNSIDEAFDRLLGTGRPAYIPKSRVTIETVIALTTRSGGVNAVAHPYSLGLERYELEAQVEEWAKVGLVGLESYYGRYSPELREQLAALARRNGLVPTGGSDFHGSYKPDISIGVGTGDLLVPDEVLSELRERATSTGR
jgi:predicted metal-dependent phosphoesterase TrpH